MWKVICGGKKRTRATALYSTAFFTFLSNGHFLHDSKGENLAIFTMKWWFFLCSRRGCKYYKNVVQQMLYHLRPCVSEAVLGCAIIPQLFSVEPPQYLHPWFANNVSTIPPISPHTKTIIIVSVPSPKCYGDHHIILCESVTFAHNHIIAVTHLSAQIKQMPKQIHLHPGAYKNNWGYHFMWPTRHHSVCGFCWIYWGG